MKEWLKENKEMITIIGAGIILGEICVASVCGLAGIGKLIAEEVAEETAKTGTAHLFWKL